MIIGSGPAGYTAAIYAARANLQPLLITGFKKGGIPGGQLMTTTFVENFPGFPDGIIGPDLMDLMKTQAIRWGTKLLEVDADQVNLNQHPFKIKTLVQTITSNSLIIATGASANKLGIPSEKKFWSNGISACAICDGATPQFRNEDLAVVGGGDSACEEAVYLTKYGSHVHLLVRSNQLKASKAMSDRVEANKRITIHWETELIDVEGGNWIEKLIVKKIDSCSKESIKVKGLFYAIGHTPNTDLFKGQLSINSHGYIKTDPGRPETSVNGVFAAGDVADHEWRQGITAASSGCKAALAAERWLSQRNLSSLIERKNIEPAITQKPDDLVTSSEENFQFNSLWQKGSYALRKLYHESSNLILVVYTSPNCGPCHILKPQLKRVIQELKSDVQGVEIDIDEEEDIAKQAGVNGTPTVQIFLKKELKIEWKGIRQRSEFKEEIMNLLS